MKKFLAISGPNLNLLGTRKTSIYKESSLDEIHAKLRKKAAELGVEVDDLEEPLAHVARELRVPRRLRPVAYHLDIGRDVVAEVDGGLPRLEELAGHHPLEIP